MPCIDMLRINAKHVCNKCMQCIFGDLTVTYVTYICCANQPKTALSFGRTKFFQDPPFGKHYSQPAVLVWRRKPDSLLLYSTLFSVLLCSAFWVVFFVTKLNIRFFCCQGPQIQRHWSGRGPARVPSMLTHWGVLSLPVLRFSWIQNRMTEQQLSLY